MFVEVKKIWSGLVFFRLLKILSNRPQICRKRTYIFLVFFGTPLINPPLCYLEGIAHEMSKKDVGFQQSVINFCGSELQHSRRYIVLWNLRRYDIIIIAILQLAHTTCLNGHMCHEWKLHGSIDEKGRRKKFHISLIEGVMIKFKKNDITRFFTEGYEHLVENMSQIPPALHENSTNILQI